MTLLGICFLAVIAGATINPVPSDSQVATDANLREIDTQLTKIDLTDGGRVDRQLTLSSGAYLYGETTFYANVRLSSPAVANSSLTLNGGLFGIPWQTWTPSFSGFSTNPTINIAKYVRLGTLVVAQFNAGAGGTSNATTFTITLPIAADVGQAITGLGVAVDNGVSSTAPCRLDTRAASTTADVYKDFTAAAWTGSGTKNCDFFILYEAD